MNIQQPQGGLRGYLMSRRMSAPQIVTDRDGDDSDTDDEAAEDANNAGGEKAAEIPPPRRPALDRRLSVPHSMGYARPASDKPGGRELSASEKRHLEERTRESSDFLARLRQLRVAPQDAAGRQKPQGRRASMSPQRTDDVPGGRPQQQTRRATMSPHRRDMPKNLTDSMATVKMTNVHGSKALDDDSESTRSSKSKRSLERDIMRQVFSEEDEEEGGPPPDEREPGRSTTIASDKPPHPHYPGQRRASAPDRPPQPHHPGPRRASAPDRPPPTYRPGQGTASASSDGNASDRPAYPRHPSSRRVSAASTDSGVSQTSEYLRLCVSASSSALTRIIENLQ